MRLIHWIVSLHEKPFRKGAPLEKMYPIHEAFETFMLGAPDKTQSAPHVRDGLDIKRLMSTVIIALIPCIIMALYNTGLQANLAIQDGGALIDGWRTWVMQKSGLGFDPGNVLSCFLHGAVYFVPILIVTYAVGGLWEVLFSVVRGHEINEGFLVTGMLFPLICPPTMPLVLVGAGVSFGVVIGKEIFGGTGMNIFNPAITARGFLFFAYPLQFSGDMVWVAGVDGYSGATLLAAAADTGMTGINQMYTFMDAFLGTVRGSMGETSTLACLFGAVVLLVTRVGSWRSMLGCLLGTVGTVLLLNALARFVDNPFFAVPVWWHIVMGGWAFGTVFMVTDPVTSPYHPKAKYIYGALIGILVVLIRVVNPAFPGGMLLAILMGNVFAATFDHFLVEKHMKRRALRNATA